ncbi:MAG: WecB/TagA/CpsF family glycosyltransferase [Cytophagia bacterium]|nr:WecB/TagA/CpsF family glycosyltransferase [Cytophagia bacterium]
MERVFIRGVGIYPFSNCQELLAFIGDHKGILVAVNAEKLMKAEDQLKALVNQNIGYSDGMGAIWALRTKGHKNIERIPGVELWLKIIENGLDTKSFYLVGGQEEVIVETVKKLRCQFEGINIVGYRNGYIKTDREKEALMNDIVSKKPDMVFVAMGSPKQEMLMEEMARKHPAVYQGLGGSFDVFTSRIKRSPKLLQKLGLEWSYRLMKQPSRFWRYLPLFRFFFLIITRRL